MKLSKNVFPKSSWYYPMKNVFWKDSDIFDIEKSEFCGFNNLDQKSSKKKLQRTFGDQWSISSIFKSL